MTDPGASSDLFIRKSPMQVINLVAQDNPGQSCELCGAGSMKPMSNGHVLNPLHVTNIIDVTLLVNLIRLDDERMLEP